MKAQLFGLADRLGWEAQFYPVHRNFSRLTLLLLRHLPVSFVARFLKFRLPSLEKETDFLISVGGYGGWIGALLASLSHLPIIQIQNPRAKNSRYHFIITCQHDGLEGRYILPLPTALHGVTEPVLKKAKNQWQKILNPEGKTPFLGILLGGNKGRYHFDAAAAKNLAHDIKRFLEKKGGVAYILHSRRTPPEILEILRSILGGEAVSFWDEKTVNPYLGVLACADVLCVTGDSVSMLSEAAATQAELGIFSLRGHSKKLEKFHHLLFSTGRAQAFTSDMKLGKCQPLDEGDRAVSEIKKRFHL